jgi:hypothetical protein
MQTFMPYPNLQKSVKCLDNKRLGKQRVETFQLLCALDFGPALNERAIRTGKFDKPQGWANHPAAKMWAGCEYALAEYFNESVTEWMRRGFNNTLKPFMLLIDYNYPDWFGDPKFHRSHKSNLLRKDPVWYGQFNWDVSPNLEYVWPTR